MAVTRLAAVTGGGHNTDGFDMVLDTTGSNFVVVLVTYHTGTTGLPTATVDGVACTAHGATPSNGSRATRMLYIANPTQGASITVSVRGTDASISSTGVAIAYSGVDTAAPLGVFPTPTTGTDTTPATPTFAANAGDYVLMYFGHIGGSGGTSVSARGSGQTQIAHATILPTSSSGSGMLVDEGALGDTTGTWTISTTRDWGSAGVAIKAAAGGTFTLTAEAGSVSVAGTAATLAYNRHVSAQAGSVALTGTAATLAHNRRISAEAGAVVITGTDATLNHNTTTTFTLAADPGAYTIAGTAAVLAYNRHLVAQPGSIAITGSPITLRLIINGTPGSFVITPTDATLVYRRKVTAGAGAVAITGTAATLRHNRVLAANSGLFALTGTDVTLTYSAAGRVTLIGDPGAFAITSTTAALRTVRRIAAESGAFNWTGQDAALRAMRSLVAEAGEIVISGQDASLEYSAIQLLSARIVQLLGQTRTTISLLGEL